MSHSYIVFDFETTGLSPNLGDRVIEVGAVLIEDGKIKDKFQTLMNPGKKIPAFIESYTGITNAMLKDAPKNADGMKELFKFMGKAPLVAHNASFDKRFLQYEFEKIGKTATTKIACSLLVGRRLYQDAPNHKLKTLVELNEIKISGDFHRALADAEMTAHLWMKMNQDLREKHKIRAADFDFMHSFCSVPKKDVLKYLAKHQS